VLDNAHSYWREISRLSTNVPLTTEAFDTEIPLPVSTQFPSVQPFSATRAPADLTLAHPPTISNFKVAAVNPQLGAIADNVTPTPGTGQSDDSLTYYYLAQADVTLPVLNRNITAKVRRVFQKEQLSPWNWAIFYVDPLEIQPGAAMNVTGWVHTNSNLYTGHNLLTFASKVTYGSDWVIGFRPGDSRAIGGSAPEVPTSPNYAPGRPPAYDVAHQPFGLDATRIFDPTDGNPNNDSYHELIEQKTGTQPDPLANKRYYDQAGAKVLINGSNVVTIKDSNNVTVTSGPLFNTITAALTTNQSIQDNREAAAVRIADLNVGTITTAINNGTLPANVFNGIIYVSDTSAGANGGTPKRGIRLKNGKLMPTGGLTIASANPVYIQGDYNTGGSNPPSNSGTYTQPDFAASNPSLARQPCAVIADAVTILSNAWTDPPPNTTVGLEDRVASNTTVNTAIVAGIVPSANNLYSGGAENFPRFLEKWSGKTMTYYGSMVQLYQSRQAIAPWGSANVYGAPNRKWYFDTKLQTSSPKGSFAVYSYVKGRWFLAP
jgi:hypothetical protein